MENRILSLLVSNHFGVLTRVTGLFSRRGFNIKELTVGETDDPMISRITILTEGDEKIVEQIQKQLIKLEDVKKAAVLPQEGSVDRELLLIKVEARLLDEIGKQAEAYGGRILDLSQGAAIIEITGETSDIDGFIDVMKKHGILELCRTGVTALQKGSSTIYNIKQIKIMEG